MHSLLSKKIKRGFSSINAHLGDLSSMTLALLYHAVRYLCERKSRSRNLLPRNSTRNALYSNFPSLSQTTMYYVALSIGGGCVIPITVHYCQILFGFPSYPCLSLIYSSQPNKPWCVHILLDILEGKLNKNNCLVCNFYRLLKFTALSSVQNRREKNARKFKILEKSLKQQFF